MSWKPEVKVHNDGTWYQNDLVFASEQEAKDSAKDLFTRWTQCVDHRAAEIGDVEPNYKRVGNSDIPLTISA